LPVAYGIAVTTVVVGGNTQQPQGRCILRVDCVGRLCRRQHGGSHLVISGKKQCLGVFSLQAAILGQQGHNFAVIGHGSLEITALLVESGQQQGVNRLVRAGLFQLVETHQNFRIGCLYITFAVGITRQQICTAIKQTLELQLGGSPNAHVHQTSKNRQRQRTQDQQPATSGRTGSLGGKRLVVEEKLALEFEFKGLALGPQRSGH